MDLDEGRNESGEWEKEAKEQRKEEEEEEEPGIEGERETQRREEKNREVAKKARRSTPISTYSPAYISEPIYQWEVSSDDRIFYDKMNDFIIHQNVKTKALLVTDIKKDKENYKGVYVKFDKEMCEHICFSMNRSFFLYYCINPNKVEISDILNNHNVYLNIDINKINEYDILAVFWLKSITTRDVNKNITSSYFVIVTNNTIEIFTISFDNLIITPLKKHYIKSKYCWYNENSSYIILLSSNKNHVIYPYLLNHNNVIKLPKIELNIMKTDMINKNDIEIVTLYDDTYCIHKDFKNGRISFRCLSSTVYFDYVLDLFYNGIMDIFSVDNLFGVFNYTNEKIYLFDIKYRKKKKHSVNLLSDHLIDRLNGNNLNHNRNKHNDSHDDSHDDSHNNHIDNHIDNDSNNINTINISYLTSPKCFKMQIDFNHISFKSFNVLIDDHHGNVYKVMVDYDLFMLQICQYFSSLVSSYEQAREHSDEYVYISPSVDILLRRPNCKNRITEMFFLAMENNIQIEDFRNIVNIINVNYRKLIEQCARKGSSTTMTKTNKKIIQPLDSLLKNLKDKTLITERDIVTDAFHPFMIKKYNLNKKETLFNFSLNFREMEKNKKEKKKDSLGKNNYGEKYMLKYKIKKKTNPHNDDNLDLSDDDRVMEKLAGTSEQVQGEKCTTRERDMGKGENRDHPCSANESSGEKKRNDYGKKESTDYCGKESTDYCGKESTDYCGKESTDYCGKESTDYCGKGSTDYCGKESTDYCGKENSDLSRVNNPCNQSMQLDRSINDEYKVVLSYSELQTIPIFLIYVLEYMKSLLCLNIIPNRILQTFLFDLCIFFKQDNCLRQLLQFYVISDSIEVSKRLFHYWKLTEHEWAYQFCLDMSLRLNEYEMVVHLFLSAKKFVKIIHFIRTYNLIDYPISVILQAIENDFDSPDNDSNRDPEKFPLPNLQVSLPLFETSPDVTTS
ncbi:conserved Plasmodium protein, unknown function [Plasmodium ovale]|uniref:Mic1 domain-containing protein n=1 Tax=Plasmodium ovale TaxID=36330 RepID=A0A1C3L5G7_PLAOA|nr:conserved Plasmodium protein, unknown function [Plasmodium ovale]